MFVALLTGCGEGPSGILAPEWQPVAAAARALEDYDSNGDRTLSGDELKKCPGLLSGIQLFDNDRDGSISEEELKSKLQEFKQEEAALVEVPCLVTWAGQPLEGAIVEFVPETFLGDTFKPGKAVTTSDGAAFPTVSDEEIPAEYRGRVRGVPTGVFRVKITHPTVAVPAKYNTQSEVGWIVTRRHHETLTIDL